MRLIYFTETGDAYSYDPNSGETHFLEGTTGYDNYPSSTVTSLFSLALSDSFINVSDGFTLSQFVYAPVSLACSPLFYCSALSRYYFVAQSSVVEIHHTSDFVTWTIAALPSGEAYQHCAVGIDGFHVLTRDGGVGSSQTTRVRTVTSGTTNTIAKTLTTIWDSTAVEYVVSVGAVIDVYSRASDEGGTKYYKDHTLTGVLVGGWSPPYTGSYGYGVYEAKGVMDGSGALLLYAELTVAHGVVMTTRWEGIAGAVDSGGAEGAISDGYSMAVPCQSGIMWQDSAGELIYAEPGGSVVNIGGGGARWPIGALGPYVPNFWTAKVGCVERP